jgi:hypothetical protein
MTEEWHGFCQAFIKMDFDAATAARINNPSAA